MSRQRRRRGGVSTHRVQRSLAAITVRTKQAYDAHEARQRELAARETTAQFKVTVNGTANGHMAWSDHKITFHEPFYSDSERDSDFDVPHFTFGYELPTGAPIMLSAHVRVWDIDQDEVVRGATVRIGVCRPGLRDRAADTVKFRAITHLTFQGWAAPTLNDDEG
jgi:hypothetical protein